MSVSLSISPLRGARTAGDSREEWGVGGGLESKRGSVTDREGVREGGTGLSKVSNQCIPCISYQYIDLAELMFSFLV